MLWYNREHPAHNVSNTTFDRFMVTILLLHSTIPYVGKLGSGKITKFGKL